MQWCKDLSSLRMIWPSYSLESPLDSTAIYPINRFHNYHHETGKKQTLSRSYLCLAHIPLEVDDDDLVHLKMEHLSWLHLLVEDLQIAPHTPMGEPLFWECLHISMISIRLASIKHMISSRCSSWTCTSFLHSSSCWCLEDTHERLLNILLFKTYSSSISSYYNLEANICFKHCLWTTPTKYYSMQTLVHRDCH